VVGRLFRWQAVVTLGVAALAYMFGGWPAVAAAVMGGSANLLAVTVFAVRMALLPPDASPQRRLAALVRAEAVKWGISIGLFAGAALVFPEHFLVLIVAFMATTGVYWVSFLWEVPDDRQQRG